MTAHRDRVSSLAHTTLDLGHKVDHLIRVQAQQGVAIAELRDGMDRQGVAIAELRDGMDRQGVAIAEHSTVLAQHSETLARHGATLNRIEELLGKLLDGQAILHQNDMELKRRLDERT